MPLLIREHHLRLLPRVPDADEDLVADLEDAFPNDATQAYDYDGDGYGDNFLPGTNPDACMFDFGSSTFGTTYNFTNGYHWRTRRS